MKAEISLPQMLRDLGMIIEEFREAEDDLVKHGLVKIKRTGPTTV